MTSESPNEPMSGESSTRRQVLYLLLSEGPMEATALADLLDITVVAVRRHLDLLEAAEQIRALEPTEGSRRGRGRPAKRYAITDSGRSSFNQAYDDLALEALKALAAAAGPQAVAALGQRRYSDMESRYLSIRAENPSANPIETLAKTLDADGYVTRVDVAPAGSQLCQHHCPVAHVAAAFPQLCEAETQMFSRLLGARVQRLATIAHGDGICTTHISLDIEEKKYNREATSV